MCDGGGRNRGKRKRIRGGNGENVDESPVKIVRRKLMDCISLGKSGGLAMLWKEGPKLDNSKLFAAPYGLGDSAGRPDIF
ncbi:hypothetical protein PVK06_035946 [Gossypium arboreum]|uniref:Uncharacterized protein n=1 Tax=Gossypium arboreum TaxID=29729 RepID=A0ABR0NI69_GOSAR|nr:hypothetical protein PVK06_035946 [Gossypium arboreum]